MVLWVMYMVALNQLDLVKVTMSILVQLISIYQVVALLMFMEDQILMVQSMVVSVSILQAVELPKMFMVAVKVMELR